MAVLEKVSKWYAFLWPVASVITVFHNIGQWTSYLGTTELQDVIVCNVGWLFD